MANSFHEYVCEREGHDRWHICPYLTKRLKEKGVLALHPMRYEKYFRDYTDECIEAGQREIVPFEAHKLYRKLRHEGHVWRDSSGDMYLSSGDKFDPGGFIALIKVGAVKPSNDGLFPGMSQTYMIDPAAIF